ncbi:hypothetical protein [Kaistia sp. MMO-174]|uniref:hypothetical protein n=1 Tax=Kaistia sp. MMO-174 TaxID=3081256 RepID=UPI00301AF37B
MAGADLFDDDDAEDGEPARAPAFPAAKRGPGRPKGSINRKTEAARRYYQAKGYRDPLAFLGELVDADPLELTKWFREQQLKIFGSAEGAPSLAEVASMQVKAAAELMPFLHGKMPIRVETDDDKALPILVVDLGGGQAAALPFQAGDKPMSIGAPETAENSHSDDEEDDGSHG